MVVAFAIFGSWHCATCTDVVAVVVGGAFARLSSGVPSVGRELPSPNFAEQSKLAVEVVAVQVLAHALDVVVKSTVALWFWKYFRVGRWQLQLRQQIFRRHGRRW